MHCPHCEHQLSELANWVEAQIHFCNRCGRIWINHETLGLQGVLKSPAAMGPGAPEPGTLTPGPVIRPKAV